MAASSHALCNVVFLMLCFACLRSQMDDEPYIWPLPTEYTVSGALSVSNSFQMVTTSTNRVLLNAIERYKSIIFPHTAETEPPPTNSSIHIIYNISITIKNDNADESMPYYGMDESYELRLPGVGIAANTVWGALRGLETLSQIIIYDFNTGFYKSYAVSISDEPRFSWRGVMVDTANHFLSLNTIKKVLDAMSFAKFNTLHWHIVDWASFPLESYSAPKLWDAAFADNQRYSKRDVSTIIEYAAQRGIRVVPEIDSPGHTLSWCTGYPSICPNSTCNDQSNGLLNPANEMTYQVLSNVLRETSTAFVDEYMHLGGDETVTSCWDQTQEIRDWQQANNLSDSGALLGMIQFAQDMVYAVDKKAINWVDVFERFRDELNPEFTTIQVWKAQTTLQQVVEMGFEAILSSNVAWYLNYVEVEEEGYNSWQTMYSVEPYENIARTEQQKLILGGEACLWSAYVDDSNVESSMWPRAAAVAERLWSSQHVNNTDAAEPRYAYFRCLLNERGVAAEPYSFFQPHEPPSGPGSCYVQRRRLKEGNSDNK